MNALYVDGGVIEINPSPQGGTWAFRRIAVGVIVDERAGVITPAQAGMPTISNNLTEMLALVHGLEALPRDWIGTVYSDSQVTLGRAFGTWKWNNIPMWLHHRYQAQRARLLYFHKFEHVLLAGHPTKAQLEAGIGRHGYPVSEHNVACDKACQHQAKLFLSKVAEI